MILHLGHYMALSCVLFSIGAAGFLFRRNVLISLMSIELMMNAVNLTFIAANRGQPEAAAAEGAAAAIPHHRHIFTFFVIAVAAAEAAVGLAIVLAFYRLRKTVRTDAADLLRG